MNWLGDTLALYVRVFRRGAALTAANWPLALLVVVYPMGLVLLSGVVQPLGIIGGVLWTTALAACVSSWLHFMEQVVQTGRAHLPDLPRSFGTYLGDVINVLFLLFVLRLLAVLVLQPASSFLYIVLVLAMAVFFNAVLELIYLGRHSGADLLMASYRFIGTNWIEWFPATILLLALALAVDGILPPGPYGMISVVGVGLVVAYASIVRGLLYLELATSSRRAREFKRRAEG